MGGVGRGGPAGEEVFGRAGHPRPHLHDRYEYVYDNYLVSKEGRVFDTRPNNGKRGSREQIEKSDLSWAHPAAMAAVLSYARTAFRNGFRKEAAEALAPYYAVSAAQSGTVAQ